MFFGLTRVPLCTGKFEKLRCILTLIQIYAVGRGAIFMFVPCLLVSSLYVLKHFIWVFNAQEEEIFRDSRAEASGRKIILEENKKQTDTCMGKDIMYAWLICIHTNCQSLFYANCMVNLATWVDIFACTTHFCLKGFFVKTLRFFSNQMRVFFSHKNVLTLK